LPRVAKREGKRRERRWEQQTVSLGGKKTEQLQIKIINGKEGEQKGGGGGEFWVIVNDSALRSGGSVARVRTQLGEKRRRLGKGGVGGSGLGGSGS